MDEILNEGTAVSGHRTNVVQFMDTTELYAGSRPRTSGDVIEEYAEVKKQPAVATFDVLQQTPKLLDEDVDQYHYESTREERPTNKTATGVWQTAEKRDLGVGEFEFVNDLGHHTYVLREEEVTIELEPQDVVLQDDKGKTVALIAQAQNKTIIPPQLEHRLASNIKMHKRAGLFGMSDLIPEQVDAVTPKIDGEALYIRVNENRGFAVDRKGSRFSVSIKGRFEREGRSSRSVSMLTEWVPKVQPGAEVYVTHVWQFGTPNGVGVRYTKTLLQQKKIQIAWKEGDYRLDLTGRKHYSCTTVPLRFPTFGVKSDGLVIHRGTNQRFLKPYRTADIKDAKTYEELERRGVVFDKKYPGKVVEFVVNGVAAGGDVDHKIGIKLNFVKFRRDKVKENGLDNILDMLASMDFDTWFDELDERMDNGSLERPPGWDGYKRFIIHRNPEKIAFYEG